MYQTFQTVGLIIFILLVLYGVWRLEKKRTADSEDHDHIERIKSQISSNIYYDLFYFPKKATITYDELAQFIAQQALRHVMDIQLFPYKDRFTVCITYKDYTARINISSSVITGFTGEYNREAPPLHRYN